jgi:hypothetical protein
MMPLAEAIVCEVLRELEASGLLGHLPAPLPAEQMAELWQVLLVRVTRVLARARLGVPEDSCDDDKRWREITE